MIALALAKQARQAGNAGMMARRAGRLQAARGKRRGSYNPMWGLSILRLVMQDAVDLSKAGLKVDAAEVAEKTGYKLEKAEMGTGAGGLTLN